MRYFLFLSTIIVCISCNNKKDKEAKVGSDTTSNQTGKDSLGNGKLVDTSFLDLTGRFRVSIPAYADTSIQNLTGLNVAVIPLDSLGTMKIAWNEYKQEVTKETEKEFETSLLECKNGKDKAIDAGVITVKKNGYCERTGYNDYAMGSVGTLYYCSYTKENNLVIIELFTRWSACGAGYETEAERKACETEKEAQKKKLDEFVENLVSKLTFLHYYS
jgi:hypothetical protein